jgi:2-oxoglutarate dehydrogenase E1 component
MSAENLSFLSGVNAEYIAHLYAQYLKSPSSVDPSWQSFFRDLKDAEVALLKELHGASWTPLENRKSVNGFDQRQDNIAMTSAPRAQVVPFPTTTSNAHHASVATGDVRQAAQDSIRALMLIRAYRVRGHLEADLDPLGMRERSQHQELDPAFYGFTNADYSRQIYIGGVLGLEYATLPEIMSVLKETYCGKIGVEYMHMFSPEEKDWIQRRIEEPHNRTEFTSQGKKAILQRLTAAEGFEQYLHKKYTGTKRFGVDGGEALIPAIEQIMKRGGQMGLKEIVIGMAHRGRLNVLANVMGKPFTAIFAEFQGMSSVPEDVLGSGDVKYHMGTSSDRDFDGNTIHLSLTANPSHLEFVNPVVIGKVRAKQIQRQDYTSEQVMPMLLHGDAAFAGQGITAETLMISELPGYRVGGTIHIVINNQIGFTTMPKFGRSGPYCTDVAKMLSAPIFHVNGDDPEAVVHVARIATEYRQTFKKDVVIDMFCYRRYGHNEGDEPAFTQPLMYKKIAEQKSTKTLYTERLMREGILSATEAKQIDDDFTAEMDAAFEASKSYKPNNADWLKGAWDGLSMAHGEERRGETAISIKKFREIGEKLTTIPKEFDANKKLVRLFEQRKEMLASGKDFDWGTAEALAYGSLLVDKYPVRLSGQDVGRGTFSHRHAILYDQSTAGRYIPHQHIEKDQAKFEVHDSPLSEMAVLGFEYGYSLADPMSLTIWEAQFGDFANGAQVIIDQFISSGESKWLRMSGLVMLLPHGYEGQGPEHSSARPERFLQMCADDNWQICNITTPANLFHVLRRQMVRDFRKPLVIFTPKSLLRHKLAVSNIEDFTGDSTFHRILWDHDQDKLAAAKKIRKVILCSGKVYYDLLEERRTRKDYDVRILRLEQIYPFPSRALEAELAQNPNADIIWCQEEPKNQGYWGFVQEELENVLVRMKHKCKRPVFVGRPASASPATGMLKRHQVEQLKVIDEALK